MPITLCRFSCNCQGSQRTGRLTDPTNVRLAHPSHEQWETCHAESFCTLCCRRFGRARPCGTFGHRCLGPSRSRLRPPWWLQPQQLRFPAILALEYVLPAVLAFLE